VALPILWGAAYLFIQAPVITVQIGGVATGIFLLAVVVAVWYLRRTEVDPRLYGGGLFNAVLIISSIAIVLLGVYSALSVFGLTPGKANARAGLERGCMLPPQRRAENTRQRG
jgi:hypothetical protein